MASLDQGSGVRDLGMGIGVPILVDSGPAIGVLSMALMDVDAIARDSCMGTRVLELASMDLGMGIGDPSTAYVDVGDSGMVGPGPGAGASCTGDFTIS